MAVHHVTVIIYWFLIIKCDYRTVSGTWSLEHSQSIRHISAVHSLSGTSQQFMQSLQCHELSGTWSLEHSQSIRHISAVRSLSGRQTTSFNDFSIEAGIHLNCQALELSGTWTVRHLKSWTLTVYQALELSGIWSLEHSQSIRHISAVGKAHRMSSPKFIRQWS